MNFFILISKPIKPAIWLKFFILIFLFIALLIPLINYIIDPFGIFQSNFLTKNYQLNKRFAKIEYLEKNKDKYDSYIFGSSRAGVIDPKVIKEYFPRNSTYNLSVGWGKPHDAKLMIQYLLENNFNVKNIFLQVDLDSMKQYKVDNTNYMLKHHYNVVKSNKALFYLDYLFVLPIVNLKEKLYNNLIYDKGGSTIDLKNGMWNMPAERMIQEQGESYFKTEKTLNQNTINRTYKGRKIQQTINEIKEIFSYSQKYNFKLHLFITPHNYNALNKFVISDYLLFLKEISFITPFYDFSGYNYMTLNIYNYYESSHYRPVLFDSLAKIMFMNNEYTKYYITKKNIKSHIKNKVQEIKNYEEKLYKKDK